MAIEAEHLGWLVKRVQHRNHRRLDAALKTMGLTLVQWNALREIARGPGLSQHKLAERTFNSDQAFGMLLTRLEAAGLVGRSEGKGRATIHELTPRGVTLLEKGQLVMTDVTNKSFESLSLKERTSLYRLLDKVLRE